MKRPELTEKERNAEIDSWRWRIRKLGMNDSQFAVKAKRTQADVSRWLSKKVRPTEETFWYLFDFIAKLEKKKAV